ncbi:MAG: SIS domain-containing protein, partial [Verrucomicrobiota bacterium]
MSAYDQFVTVARSQFDRVAETQRSAITTAGEWLADSLARQGFLYAFGTGHSHMVAEEIFYRAGHLARAVPILEETLMMHLNAIEATYLER